MLKAVWFGIRDYIKDVQHDKLVDKAEKKFHCKVLDAAIHFGAKKANINYIDAVTWKEGSVWHYIRQYMFTVRNS